MSSSRLCPVFLLSEYLVEVVSWQSEQEHGRETFIILQPAELCLCENPVDRQRGKKKS